MPTTRDQYVGLKEEVLSTRMKVMGEEEMEGITREMRTMFVEAEVASAGVKMPSSRKVLMLPMRRSEEAEGESRMMGSRRLVGLRCRLETREVEWGAAVGADLELEGRLRRYLTAMSLQNVKS